MGVEHGGYCLGCCWVLMAMFVFVEKLLPGGVWIGRAGGNGAGGLGGN